MFRLKTIKAYVTTLVLAATLPLVALWAFTAWSHMRFRQETAWSLVHQIAQSTAANVHQFIGDSKRILESMATEASHLLQNPSECESFLLSAAVAAPQYGGFSITDPSGRVLCTSVPTEVETVHDRDWFQLVSREGEFVVGEPVVGLVSREWVSVLAVPINDDAGERLGYLTAAVNMARFQELLNSSTLPEEAVATLVNTADIMVARSRDPEQWVGQQISALGPEYEDASARERIALSAEGIPYMWAWEILPEADWFVYSGLPADWALQRSLPSLGLGIALGSIFVFAVLLFASGIYRRVRLSLSQLVEGTRQTGAGQNPLDESELAEVAEIARQFNATLSDRAEAEAGLRSAKELYQSVLENAALGILVASEDGRIIEANSALANMLGVDAPSGLVDESVVSRFHDTEVWDGARAELSKNGEGVAIDTLWVRDTGDHFAVRLSMSGIALRGGGAGFVLLAEDLTERHQLEAQLRQAQKLESVGRLAGGIAHDFNNRLTVIQNCAEIVRERVRSDPELNEAVVFILESVSRSAELTRQLLTFSRRQITSRRTVDLNFLISNFQKMLRRGLEEDLTIEMKLAPQVCPVSVDSGQLEQVILNIASNAGDAMPEGGELVFSTRLVELSERDAAQYVGARRGEYAVLSVGDSGCGMDEEVLNNALEPFFTTKPVGKGTGLGLSTAYGIVQQHDGHIRLFSEKGVGTTVEIWLPRADPDDMPVDDGQPSETSPQETNQGTVLVAEDDPAVLKVVNTILKRAGYDVLAATSGLEALNVANEHDGQIDALITDWIMPGIRGPELAKKLSKERPGLKVLYMSGYTDELLGAHESDFVPGIFLGKPFTVGELLSRLAEATKSP